MTKITSTELARHLKSILDRVEHRGEGFTIIRNQQVIGHIIAGPAQMTALEALADIYRTLPEEAAKGWLEDAKTGHLSEELRDPWES